jgi:hypothetical protein
MRLMLRTAIAVAVIGGVLCAAPVLAQTNSQITGTAKD